MRSAIRSTARDPLPQGLAAYPLRASPPPAHSRGRVAERLDLGGAGDGRLHHLLPRPAPRHVFAGSGVGKSVLLSMLARRATCDAVVVGLIGERGREVREFIEETLHRPRASPVRSLWSPPPTSRP